jgi:NitT/TauT family transport system permease protein
MHDETVKNPVLPIQNRINQMRVALVPISTIAVILAWAVIVEIKQIPAFILPSPLMVWVRFRDVLLDGSLVHHLATTMSEILLGLFFGVTSASILGYILAKFPIAEKILSPYIVASQSVPVVAIAPLLAIWFPAGIFSKILICSLIVFFPVLVNTIVGLRSVPEDLRDLMRSMRATRFQTIRYLEVPASLPVFLGGLRIGVTLSVIGAVVGEFVGSDRGMGFMINQARGLFDTALVFVTVFVLILVALSLYLMVVLVERKLLYWNTESDTRRTISN